MLGQTREGWKEGGEKELETSVEAPKGWRREECWIERLFACALSFEWAKMEWGDGIWRPLHAS